MDKKVKQLVESLLLEASDVTFLSNNSLVPADTYKVLLNIINAFNKGLPAKKKVNNPTIFNSGYTGVIFNLGIDKEKRYALMYSPGETGMEDHSIGSITYQQIGTSQKIKVYGEKDDSGRTFGDTNIKDMKGALRAVTKFAKNISK